ncbi:PREDICTED: uncharacterized protein LOC108618004 [Drosophila arizonae]|uniref:Uncharacterized protein LOC108618004 n=1 Tax=Drosophila arizonae TaxID=7263 RepID=A0ABM1PQB2_DROAR|nr:PREDICTED: uncharacterized protein LOC108618004 [Drosophila arizonae]
MNESKIYASYVESKLIGVQAEDVNQYVVRALKHVIQDVFAQLSATLIITLATSDAKMDKWFGNVVGNLASTWSSVSVQMLHVNHLPHVPGRKYCNLLLVVAVPIGSIITYILIPSSSTQITEDNADSDDHEYYFIFLQARDAQIPAELQQILDHCLNNFWLHCNVMVQTAQMEVLIYSYYPYTSQRCQSAQPQLVNRFDGQRMIHAPMFPHKLRQLHQCPLTVVVWNAPPFVELKWDDRAGQMDAIGFEATLIKQLARHLNCSLIWHNVTLETVATYQKNWGDERQPMSPLKLLIERHANLSVGNFRKTAGRNNMLTSPVAHYYAPLVATVAIKHFQFGQLTLLYFPFQSCVWLLLLVALILHGLIYMWRWRPIGLQVLELLLGVTLVRLPRSWLQRVIYAHWLYGSIPLRVVYQSLLFHFIRLQLFETLPYSFEQLLASNFRGMCTSNILSMLREMPQVAHNYESYISIPSPYDEVVLDALHQMGDGRYFAITGLDTAVAHLTATNRQRSYHILSQYINLQQVVIYMPKHTYFKELFNDMLRNLDASGCIDFWRRDAFAKYSRRTLQQRSLSQLQDDQQEHRQNEQLRQLIGIYSLMGTLYALSILVFCAELLCHRLTKRKMERRLL